MKRSGDSLTNALNGGFKPFLLVCTVCAFALDLTVCLYAAISGMGPEYISVLFLLLAVNGLFLLAVIFSNFRFAYTVWEIVIYAVATGLLIGLAGNSAAPYGDGRVVLTTAAGISWLIVHILTVIAAAVTWLHASRCIRPKRLLQTIVAAVFTAVMVAVSIYYVCFIAVKGVTGQGAGMRSVMFRYNEATQTYTAASLYPGRERKLVIPDTFNGRPVREICDEVFADDRITEIRLECSPDVTFTETAAGRYTAVTADITADKRTVDVLRQKLYSVGAETDNLALFSAANRLRPTGLAAGEAYVTFSYTPEEYRMAEGKPLATWIGRKGSVLSLDGLSDADYITRRDNASPEDLYWHYTRTGYILRAPQVDGRALEGAPITENYAGVPVTFERVAAVRLTADNDDKYEIDDKFRYTVLSDRQLDCRLTAVSRADEMLAAIPRREGFGLQFLEETDSGRLPIDSLSTLLRSLSAQEACTATINPVWSLNAPKVTVTSDRAGNVVCYGDSIALTADATAPTADARLAYRWQRAGAMLGEEPVYTEDSMPFSSDTYRVSVYAKADCTSLTSETTADIYVRVNPRPLSVVWTADEDTVYSGREKNVSCAFAPGAQILSGDDVLLQRESGQICDAKRYTVAALLSGADAYKYILENGQINYTVTPAPVRVTWANTAFVYNGGNQCPTATAVGVDGERLSVTVTGGRTNAGTYTAAASIGGAQAHNYAVENAAETFTIAPLSVAFVWGDEAFTYNGKIQYPRVDDIQGCVAKDRAALLAAVTYSGDTKAKNAGSYSVSAAVANGNYMFGNAEKHFAVARAVATVAVDAAETIYGQEPVFTGRIVGLAAGDPQPRIEYTIDCVRDAQGHIPVGTYTVTAVVTDATGNYEWKVVPGRLDVTPEVQP